MGGRGIYYVLLWKQLIENGFLAPGIWIIHLVGKKDEEETIKYNQPRIYMYTVTMYSVVMKIRFILYMCVRIKIHFSSYRFLSTHFLCVRYAPDTSINVVFSFLNPLNPFLVRPHAESDKVFNEAILI